MNSNTRNILNGVNSNNSIINVNSLISATNTISKNFNRKSSYSNNNNNQSPFILSSLPNYQSSNNFTPLKSSFLSNTISKTFNTPLGAPNNPLILNNPLGTLSSPMKILVLEGSLAHSSSLSSHSPIITNRTLAASKIISSLNNTSYNNFNSIPSHVTSPQLVETNLTGNQTIHSNTKNPFEGIY